MGLLSGLSYLHEPFEEAVGADEVDVEVKNGQHADLHLYYLLLVVGLVTHIHIVFDKWWPDLLVFASNEHGGDADKLQIFF